MEAALKLSLKANQSEVKYMNKAIMYVCVYVRLCESAQFATIGCFQQIPGTQALLFEPLKILGRQRKFQQTHTYTQMLFVHAKQVSRKQRE